MTDILLIQPPIRDFYITSKRTIPYGLTCIAAVLIEKGFSVEILDGLAVARSRVIPLPHEMEYLREYYHEPDHSPFSLFYQFKHFGYSFEHLGAVVKKIKPFFVGISSLFTPYHNEAVMTAEIVKTSHPACKIVMGGHHATAMPEKLMESEAVDFVLRGEGEVSMPLLAKAIKNGTSYSTVPGIVHRVPGGLIKTSESVVMKNLTDFPNPAAHLVKHKYYRRGKRGSIVIMGSRGCPMKCSYCSLGGLSLITYRKRTVESVLDEIETAVHLSDTAFVDFEDENLTLDRIWFLELLNEIQRRFKGLNLELRAMNGLYPPSLDGEVIRTMKDSGFKILNLSLGSTSAAQLKSFKRSNVIKSFDDALMWTEKNNLEAVGYVIAGAPNQTGDGSVKDLLFLAERRVLAGVSIFYPSPGSADFQLCRDLGLLPENLSLMRSSALPVSHTTSRLESSTLLRLGRMLNFMKLLMDEEGRLPAPELIMQTHFTDEMSRVEKGKKLLQWFLNDGLIRGVHMDGSIYEHRISTTLTDLFIQGLQGINVRGCR